MGVGDSLEVAYALTGPLAAGTYSIDVHGQAGAPMHADLIFRHLGTDQVLLSSDVTNTATGEIVASMAASSLPASCDDLIVLRVTNPGPTTVIAVDPVSSTVLIP